MKIIFLILIIFSSFIIKAQDIEGQIINGTTKSPITNATVYFNDLQLNSITDSLGRFNIHISTKFPISIQIKALGYKTKQHTLVKNNTTIELEELHYKLNEVIVSIPTGKLQRQHITNVESRKMKELSYIPSTNIIQQIANIPGVDITGNGAGISKPTIRGLSGSRIVTLLNGLRLENQQWGADHGSGVTALGIKGVEVIKGPASLLYGSDALGGILYFTDIDYTNATEGFVKSSFESNSLGINNQIGVSLSKNKLKANIMASQSSQADYQIPTDKYIKNARYKDLNFKTALGYQHKSYNLNVRYNYLSARVGIPGHSHNSNATLSDYLTAQQGRSKTIPAQVIENHYLLLDNKFYLTNSSLSIKIGQVSNHLREFDEKITLPAINMLLNTSNYNIQWNKKMNKATLIIGGQGMVQQNKNETASEHIIPNALTVENGIFGLFTKDINNWSFQSGLRYDNKSLHLQQNFKGNENGTSTNYNSLNYSIGLSTSKNNHLFRMNASSGFRAPNSSELYSNGIHHGALRYEIGSNNLVSEQANQIDLSWEISKEHLAIVINPYFNQISNYIYISPLDSIIDETRVYKYNQANNALLFGGEAGIHYHPHFAHHFHIESSFSYTEGRLSSENYLPLIPQPKVNTLLKLEGKKKGKVALENISLQHLYYLAQNKLGINETYSVDYHLINLGCQIKFDLKSKVILDLGIQNLFNTYYVNHISQLKQLAIPSPGRNFHIGLKINIK